MVSDRNNKQFSSTPQSTSAMSQQTLSHHMHWTRWTRSRLCVVPMRRSKTCSPAHTVPANVYWFWLGSGNRRYCRRGMVLICFENFSTIDFKVSRHTLLIRVICLFTEFVSHERSIYAIHTRNTGRIRSWCIEWLSHCKDVFSVWPLTYYAYTCAWYSRAGAIAPTIVNVEET